MFCWCAIAGTKRSLFSTFLLFRALHVHICDCVGIRRCCIFAAKAIDRNGSNKNDQTTITKVPPQPTAYRPPHVDRQQMQKSLITMWTREKCLLWFVCESKIPSIRFVMRIRSLLSCQPINNMLLLYGVTMKHFHGWKLNTAAVYLITSAFSVCEKSSNAHLPEYWIWFAHCFSSTGKIIHYFSSPSSSSW